MFKNQKDMMRTSSGYAAPSHTSNFGHKHSDSASSAPPEHLSEFYSFMNSKSNSSITPQHSPNVRDFSNSNKRLMRQPSLNTFTSFTPSVMDLPSILTSKDFEASVASYENMLAKAEGLRKALLTVSEAASDFGQALEDTINNNPKVNNNKQVSDGLINAGSLQYIVGSNNQILSRLLEQNFQKPISKELENLKANYKTNYNFYQQEVKAKSQELRRKELENIRLSKLKTRNLSVYKSNLMNLTSQLDEIDRLKYDYYLEVNSMIEQFNESQLLIRTGSIIRAELELFEGIARKGWSGGGLDKLLEISPDLFAINYEEEFNKEANGTSLSRQNDNHIGMDSIGEDDESFISNLPHFNGNGNDTIDPSETLETVRLQPPETPTQDRNESDSDNIEDHLNELDTSTPHIDKFKNSLIKGLDDMHMDESFSLPKVNSDSLVGSQGRNESSDFSKDNILSDI